MSEAVKAARRYDSSRRQEQARHNRGKVLAAAKELFLTKGYATTTIGQIAASAGVSVETVYKAFATKAGVVKALFDVTVAGDDEPIPVVERENMQAFMADPDLARKVRWYADHLAATFQRLAPVMLMVRAAAATDDGAAGVWRQIRQEQLTAMTTFAENLHATNGVRPDLPADHVRDLLWTLHSVEVFELLVLERGWPPERYAELVADTVVNALLPDRRS